MKKLNPEEVFRKALYYKIPSSSSDDEDSDPEPMCEDSKKMYDIIMKEAEAQAQKRRKIEQENDFFYPRTDENPSGFYIQKLLEMNVIHFRDSIHYGPEKEQRTCIWNGGHFSWEENSCGLPWIAVNGTDFTCVVVMNGETSIRPSGRHQLCTDDVLQTMLADTGVFADTTTVHTKFRRDMEARGYKEGPFAVVSVAPDAAVDDHYLNISSKCQEDAISFLKQSPQGCTSLTTEETKMIAVCALQCLLGSEFKSDKIEGWGIGGAVGNIGGTITRILTEKNVKRYLAKSPVSMCAMCQGVHLRTKPLLCQRVHTTNM